MKKIIRPQPATCAASGVDLLLFARHMQETARTSAARRLFGRFLEVELEHWQGPQSVLPKGVSYDRES